MSWLCEKSNNFAMFSNDSNAHFLFDFSICTAEDEASIDAGPRWMAISFH